MTKQMKKIEKELEQLAEANPELLFERVLISTITRESEKSTEELQAYVNEQGIQGRVGYLSLLNLTGEQITHLKNQPYVQSISQPLPDTFRRCY